jgi:hypothetical protein
MIGVGGILAWPMVQAVGIRQVTDSLNITQTVTANLVYNRSISTALSLSSIGTGTAILSRTASDALALTQSAGQWFDVSASSALSLGDNNTSDIWRPASSALALTNALSYLAELHLTPNSILNLNDQANGYNTHLYETLTLSQNVFLTIQRSVAHVLTLSDLAQIVHSVAVVSALTLTDLASELNYKNIVDALGLTDVVTHSNILNFHVTDSLSFKHAVIGGNQTHFSSCAEEYVPSPALGTRTGITLTHPYGSPTLSLDMRNPRFGNVLTGNMQTINRRLRGGQLSSGRGVTWPDIVTIRLAFEALDSVKKGEFLNFVKESSGYEIGLLDHENRQWRGVIVSPDIVSTQLGRVCNFGTEFEFRGVLT